MNWDEMTPRQRDAWVAENVMHSQIFVHIDGAYHEVAERLCNDYEKSHWWKAWWKPVKGEALPDDSYFGRYYSSRVEHDYLVLCKAREEWGGKQDGFMERDRFLFHLRCIISKRVLGDNDWIQQTVAYFYYEPGDYSHAAWMVLGEKICEEKE